MSSKIVINYDLSSFASNLADMVAQKIAAEAKNKARSIVRVGVNSGRLRNTIRVDRIGFAHYKVIAETPYALAQEYGLAPYGKPNYGFTPYMRPAAKLAASNASKFVKESVNAALKRSKK